MARTATRHAPVPGRCGKWTVVSVAGQPGRELSYSCFCECGRMRDIPASAIRRQRTPGCKSCCSGRRTVAPGERPLSRTSLYRRARRYGLSLAVVRSLLEDAACALCGRRGVVIDHDHRTSVVRGVLCGNCNTGLGMFDDDYGRLARAAAYVHSNAQVEEREFDLREIALPGLAPFKSFCTTEVSRRG